MTDAGPSNSQPFSTSPYPARPGEGPEQAPSHPVGELLDRHWEAAFAYARVCTADERAAGMLTTAAFTRLFGEQARQDAPDPAWRPHLLVTVRRIAVEWAGDSRRELVHPALHTDAAARLLPPVGRRLLARSFQRLPQASRCVLWHAEAESEPLHVAGALLGIDDETVLLELRRSRERLREELLQSHRELCVEEECHRYDRLLDVTTRHGRDLDPDLRAHLNRCRHCAHTADQLACFQERQALGVALAESVLGRSAHAYREARAAGAPELRAQGPLPGEDFDAPGTAPGIATAFGTASGVVSGTVSGMGTAPGYGTASGNGTTSGAERASATGTAFGTGATPATGTAFDADTTPGTALVPVPHRSARALRKAARRRRRNLTAAVVTVSALVVLPLVLWTAVGHGDSGTQADDATPAPGPSADGPSWVSAGDTAQGALRGRLHNVFSGLCLGITGGKAVNGAEAELATCSASAVQQWSYEPDGLLRNAATPALCLDSRLGYSVRLAPCTGGDARDIRYDFTLQGTLVPRWSQDLALAPAATDGSGALVLKDRADGTAQRWIIDTSKPDLQMQIVNWDKANSPEPAIPKKAAPPAPAPSAPAAKKTPTAPKTPSATPTPTPSASSTGTCSYYNPYACDWYGKSGSGYGSGYNTGYGSGYGYGYGSGYGYGGYGYYGQQR